MAETPRQPPRPPADALPSAIGLHRAGRLAEAEAVYRQVLASDPRCVEALHGLGVLCGQVGRFEAGIELLQEAIRQRPEASALHSDLAHALRSDGQVDAALAADRRAVGFDPNRAAAHEGLGLSLRRAGRPAEAEAHFRQAVALKAESPVALCQLGSLLIEQDKLAEAEALLRQAVRIRPSYAEALYHLGQVLRDQGRVDEAIACLRQAVQLRPDAVAAQNLLGNALRDAGQPDDAIAAYESALRSHPDAAPVHTNLGLAYQDLKQFDQALAGFDRALALRPDDADAHTYRAMLRLQLGDFEGGWAEYEWRWQIRRAFARPVADRPAWDGSDPRGRTILLYGEQGLGDTLQFVRFAPLLAARGASVILECQPELTRLLGGVEGVSAVVARGQSRPGFDLHQALLSLPRLYNTTLPSIPAEVPYIRLNHDAVHAARERLGPAGGGLRVGLVWAGRPTHRNDRNRSIALEALHPLAAVRNATFYSLQLGPAARQLEHPPAGMRVHDLAPHLRDFADTAAFVQNLDLVVSVDTAVAHLAGALGRPVWTLLPHVADWRWLEGREDTPWYPSMRLFRQSTPGDWTTVIRRVATALEAG